MTSSRNHITDDQISEVLRRGRFEDLALIAVIACFATVAALAVAMQLGAPQNIFVPVMAVVFAILFLAIGAWIVGQVRTTRSLNRLEGPNRPHAPARAYVLPWLVAIGGGIAYAGASDVVQRWLWAGFFVAGIVVFIWLQRRERARSSRRHHR